MLAAGSKCQTKQALNCQCLRSGARSSTLLSSLLGLAWLGLWFATHFIFIFVLCAASPLSPGTPCLSGQPHKCEFVFAVCAHAQLPHAASMASVAAGHLILCNACVGSASYTVCVCVSVCEFSCVSIELEEVATHARHIVATTLSLLCRVVMPKMLPVFGDALNLQHLEAPTHTTTQCLSHTHTHTLGETQVSKRSLQDVFGTVDRKLCQTRHSQHRQTHTHTPHTHIHLQHTPHLTHTVSHTHTHTYRSTHTRLDCRGVELLLKFVCLT